MSEQAGRTSRLSEQQLDEIVRRLVDALSPRRIILFGSHVYGQPTRESDVDVMVLVDDEPGGFDRFELGRRGYGTLGGMSLPVESHFRTTSAFRRRAAVPASFEQEVRARGRVLYPPAGQRGNAHEAVHLGRAVRDHVKAEMVREYLTKAQDSLATAERVLRPHAPIVGPGCFRCQQAAEQALRGFLQWHERPAPAGRNLSRLLDECTRVEVDLRMQFPGAECLTRYAAWEEGVVDTASWRVEAAEALASAKAVVRSVLDHLPTSVHPD